DPHRKLIAYDEVLRHNTKTDCWVIINGEVYDVTKFMEIHPGGVNAILKMAGKDATKAFMPIHPPDALSTLPPEYHVGTLDPTTAPAAAYAETEEEIRIRKAREALPHPEAALNLDEIERSGKTHTLSSATGSDHECKLGSLRSIVSFLKAKIDRIALDQDEPSLKSEVNIVQAAAKEGVAQGLSINASCSLDEIQEAKTSDQTLFFQIYLDRNRKNSENLLRRVEKDGFKGIILTVDSAVPGKRERDMRAKGDFQAPATGGADTNGAKGVAQ
ncbi:Cytochrome b2, mitochondrial precursor, partial [Tulasnella sp. 408]